MDDFFWTANHHAEHVRRESRRRSMRQTRRRLDLLRRVEHLEERFDRLNLVTQALWELVKRSADVDDAALAAMVREVDLSDGQLDGKAPSTVCVCPDCEQVMAPDHVECLYCGGEKLDQAPFEGL